MGEIAIEIAITVHAFFRFRTKKITKIITPRIKKLLKNERFSRVIHHYPERLDSGRYALRITLEVLGSESRSYDLEAGTKVLLAQLASEQKRMLSATQTRHFYRPQSAKPMDGDEFAAFMFMTGLPEEADLRPTLADIIMRKESPQPSE